MIKKLDLQTDVLLKIEGKVTSVAQKYPIIKQVSYNKHLTVTSYEELHSLKHIKNTVNQEYKKIRVNLQTKITPEGSKLQLTDKPDCIIWYHEPEQKFIFATHQYDLMYAADIEFAVDISTEKITDVFARELFKGE